MILALSNLGTSFASAILAKDTTTNTNNELVGKKNGEVVATGSAVKIYTANAPSDQSSRKLSCETNGKSTTCTITSYDQVEVDDGRQMVEECYLGATTVKFARVYGSVIKQVTICNRGNSGGGSCTDTYYNMIGDSLVPSSVKLCNGITIGPNKENTFYEISGDEATSDEFEGCDSSTDCDDGLECTNNMCTVAQAPTQDPVCSGTFDSFVGTSCDAADAGVECSWKTECGEGINFPTAGCTCDATESVDKDGNQIFNYNWSCFTPSCPMPLP